MSRIGKKPIIIPKGVQARIDENNCVHIKGGKGDLTFQLRPEIKATLNDNQLVLENVSQSRESRALHGASRSRIANMVSGVTEGYEKKLKIEGVGYKAEFKNQAINLNVGYSHIVEIKVPTTILVKMESPQLIAISGSDKELVGRIASKVRKTKVAEPYNGKGIFYSNEKVRRKAGKSGK